MLDIGCGWGTLAKFASMNYGAKDTGLTVAENQTAWGNDALCKVGPVITGQQHECKPVLSKNIEITEKRATEK
jgi:cyclopropane fatty-acyl-phospholipid synthase-like methyltransferase